MKFKPRRLFLRGKGGRLSLRYQILGSGLETFLNFLQLLKNASFSLGLSLLFPFSAHFSLPFPSNPPRDCVLVRLKARFPLIRSTPDDEVFVRSGASLMENQSAGLAHPEWLGTELLRQQLLRIPASVSNACGARSQILSAFTTALGTSRPSQILS